MAIEIKLNSGDYLFHQGERGDFGYIVKIGTIEIIKSNIDNDTILAILGPGSLFGEMALIDGGPRSTGARAKGQSIVTRIRANTFNAFIQNNPDIATRIIKNLAMQLRLANENNRRDV